MLGVVVIKYLMAIRVDNATRRRVNEECCKEGVPADEAETNFIIRVVCGEGQC